MARNANAPHRAANAAGQRARQKRASKRDRIGGALKGGGKGQGYQWIGKPMNWREAKRQANAEAGLQFGPLIRNERAEERASAQRANQEIPQWYNELGQTMAQGEQASAAASKAANEAMQKQLETSQAGDQANQAAIAGQNAEFAKLTGANPTAFAPSVQQAAAAAGQRAAMQNTLAMPIIASGANQAGFLAAQKGNAARDGLSQRLREGKRGRKINQDLQATLREKGGARVEALGKLREGERDFRVQQEAFGQGKKEFGAGQRSAAAEAAQKQREFEAEQGNKRVDQGQSAREIENEERKIENEEKKLRKEGKNGGLTPSEQQAKQAHWNNAKSAAKTLYERPKGWPNWAALTKAVQKESEVSPAMARRAVERLRKIAEAEDRKKNSFPKAGW